VTQLASGRRAFTQKGTKREAQIKLAGLITSVGKGDYVEPSKATVADFVRNRVDQWEAAGNISARTAQRYRQLLENQIVPDLGAKALQRLTRLEIEAWHTALKNGGLAARTIGHAHRVLSQALGDAERDGAVVKNVCKLQKTPKLPETEMVIVQDVPGFLNKVRGERLYALVVVALTTGMRLGEVLALRERISTPALLKCARRWRRPRLRELYSRHQSLKPVAAMSACRRLPSKHCGSTVDSFLKPG
jgi:hypothetical protein